MMFKHKIVLLHFILFFLVYCTVGFSQDAAKPQTAIDFTARDLNGNKVQLKKLLENGPVLIDFWALWCVPCLKELPKLQEIRERYKNRGLTIVAVNEDSPSDQSKVKPFVKQKRFDFVVVIDEDKDLWNYFKVVTMPTTLLVNQPGNIVYSHSGYKPGDEAELAKPLEALFAENKNSSSK
jgi:thiol-disulfide isomerase/thioredoxin